jgi:hypothetical protein
MAVVTRYFSTTAAGAGDGTTWADRAALFDGSGNWSTVITGFDFASNALSCLIGPGTYTCAQTLNTTTITTDPTVANPLFLQGCDSSGTPLTPSNPGWTAAEPVDWDSGLPVINNAGSATDTVALLQCAMRLIVFNFSARNNKPAWGGTLDWCVITNTNSNTAAGCIGTATKVTNCSATCSGTSYDAVVSQNAEQTIFSNLRVVGNASASSGNRYGLLLSGAATNTLNRVLVINNPGGGVVNVAGSVNPQLKLDRCVIAGNTAGGVILSSTASQNLRSVISRCMITGNGGYGIDGQSAARVLVSDSRLRDNTSGNINGLGNYPTDLNNYTTDSDDAAEYVNAGSGDYRIKIGSAIWGKGYGVADQQPTVLSLADIRAGVNRGDGSLGTFEGDGTDLSNMLIATDGFCPDAPDYPVEADVKSGTQFGLGLKTGSLLVKGGNRIFGSGVIIPTETVL